MPDNHYDLLVIGTGPAGEGAAMKAVKTGLKVAVVERYERVGGGSTHWGTIPSKALRQAIYHMNITYQNPIYQRMDIVPTYSFQSLLASANAVIEKQTNMRQGFYDRNGVRLIPGNASFIDPNTVEIALADGAHERYTATHFVIAPGSSPWRPPHIDFTHPRILDSDTLLSMPFSPRSVAIVGAGVIGCEYASMLSRMDCEVTLINNRNKLLAFLDDEIADALSYHFAECGISIRHNEEMESATPADDHVTVNLKSGKRIKADVMLFAAGRAGNTAQLGLDKISVTPDPRGLIKVNENLQLQYKTPEGTDAFYGHIYAAGDVIGPPSLASASYDQGRFAGTIISTGKCDFRLVSDIPTGIYTTPEISSLGKTEAQLTADKVPYEVGKSMFKNLARAQIIGQNVGMLKILFHRETLAILGIHCFGYSAAEIIHIGQAIMIQPPPNNTLHYFVGTTFNYPTMAEAYRVAALNGLDKV